MPLIDNWKWILEKKYKNTFRNVAAIFVEHTDKALFKK